MLEIQALKFERLFNKATDLTITRESYSKFLKDLLEMQVKYNRTDLASRAAGAARRAKKEGRLKIVNWTPVAQLDRASAS